MRRSLVQPIGLVAVLATLALWLIAAPFVSAGNPCFHDFTMPAATTATGTQIKLEPCAFSPTMTNVAVGSTVTFTNGPTFSHLITGANQAWGSRETEIRPGQTVAYRFAAAGIYPYACVLHPGMSGVIVVGDVAGAGGGGSTVGTTTGTTMAPASPLGEPALAVLAAGAGAIAGAAAIYLAMRPRRGVEEALAEAR